MTATPERGASRLTPIHFAVCLAILAGAGEVLLLLYRKHAQGEFTARSRDIYWLAPLAYLLIFTLPAAFLALLQRRWAQLPAFRLTVFGTVTAASAGLVSLHFGPRLHAAALVLLSLGLGFQASRMLGARESAVARAVRWLSPLLLAGLLVTALGMVTVRRWREHRAVAALPAPSRTPNVLLLILDTVRASSLSLYGHSRQTTPTLERLATEGVTFGRALAPAPWTLPSHASMFTGRWPHEQTTSWFRPLDKSDSTLAEALAARGYATGGFVANLIYTDYEKGLGRGFQRYRDFRFGLGLILRSCNVTRRITDSRLLRQLVGSDEILGRKPAATVNAEFLDWLDGVGDRPFFGFLNYFDAHDPYLPPAEWFQRFAGYARPNQLSPLRRLGVRLRREQMRPEDILLEQDAYEASIAWLDAEIGHLLAELDRRDLRKNTIIVVTSDHGEEFGEHGVFLHGHSLYRDALHVPLVIVAPGQAPRGERVTQTVSLRDLPATILSLVRGESATFPGASLARFWGGAPPQGEPPVLSEVQRAIRMPEWYPSSGGDLRALTDSAYHFIEHPDSNHQLFDWASDPLERANLYPTALGRARAEAYLDRLRQVPPFPHPGRKVEFP